MEYVPCVLVHAAACSGQDGQESDGKRMNATTVLSEARESILQTAMTLFYRNGYKATGINEVISESNVAKATFYAHFKSKDLLYLEALRRRHDDEIALVSAYVDQRKSPVSRFMAPIEFIEQWQEENGLRGCAFLNMTSEVPDRDSAIRKEASRHYEAIREIVERLAEDLVATEPEKYGNLQPARASEEYMIAFAGAIALTQIYSEKWPIRRAVKAIRAMLDGRG